MIQLLQNRPAALDVVLRTNDPSASPANPPRAALTVEDVVIQLKRAGATAWMTLVLGPERFLEVGHGAYLIQLEAMDVDTAGSLLILMAGSPSIAPPILPYFAELEVLPVHEFPSTRPNLPETNLIGNIAALDNRPIAGAMVMASLLEPPVLLDGVAVGGEPTLVLTDENGFFDLRLLTGSTVDVQIPSVRYRRVVIVPPPPSPGTPVRLFSIP